MIKHIELRTPKEVDAKLNEFRRNGWHLEEEYAQITYVPEAGFYLWYDDKLEIK